MRWWRIIWMAAIISTAVGAETNQDQREAVGQLLYVHSDACPYCEAWKEAIGDDWASLNTGQRWPLISTELVAGLPEPWQHLPPARFTPTFIFVRDGKEVRRIEGFRDADIWWLQAQGL